MRRPWTAAYLALRWLGKVTPHHVARCPQGSQPRPEAAVGSVDEEKRCEEIARSEVCSMSARGITPLQPIGKGGHEGIFLSEARVRGLSFATCKQAGPAKILQRTLASSE
jgi:hypothetical protein